MITHDDFSITSFDSTICVSKKSNVTSGFGTIINPLMMHATWAYDTHLPDKSLQELWFWPVVDLQYYWYHYCFQVTNMGVPFGAFGGN